MNKMEMNEQDGISIINSKYMRGIIVSEVVGECLVL